VDQPAKNGVTLFGFAAAAFITQLQALGKGSSYNSNHPTERTWIAIVNVEIGFRSEHLLILC
jgi:hypothetical protein